MEMEITMIKLTTLAALATFAALDVSSALADHSRNPGLSLYQEHLPDWMQGTNDEAGGPANELIGRGGMRLPQSRYAVSPGAVAIDPEFTDSLSRRGVPFGAVDHREWMLHNSAR
jgi:hypothetical protein